jgi:hypothetical protein
MDTAVVVFASIIGSLAIPLIIFAIQSFTERVILHRKMLRVIKQDKKYYVQYRFFIIFWVNIDNDVAYRITQNMKYSSYTGEYDPAEFISESDAISFCEKVKRLKIEKEEAKKFEIKRMYR